MLGLGVYNVSLSACVVDRHTDTLVLSARTCHAHRFCLFARQMYALSTVWLLIQIWWYGYSIGLTGGFAHVAENLSGRSIGCNDFTFPQDEFQEQEPSWIKGSGLEQDGNWNYLQCFWDLYGSLHGRQEEMIFTLRCWTTRALDYCKESKCLFPSIDRCG